MSALNRMYCIDKNQTVRAIWQPGENGLDTTNEVIGYRKTDSS